MREGGARSVSALTRATGAYEVARTKALTPGTYRAVVKATMVSGTACAAASSASVTVPKLR